MGYVWPDLPHLIQVEDGYPTFPDGTIIKEGDISPFVKILEEQLPFIPKFEKRLLIANRPIKLKHRTTPAVTVKPEDNAATIIITMPDEGCALLLGTGNCYVVKSDYRPREGEVLLGLSEYKALVPLNIWHELIEWGGNTVIDPEDNIGYDERRKIEAPLEALADCFSFYIVLENLEFCSSYSKLDIDRAVQIPLNHVVSKMNMHGFRGYYKPLLALVTDKPSTDRLNEAFNNYVNLIKDLI